MRVHELAKATSLESKEILAIAKKHRIAVKPSPSANIEDKDVRRLMPFIEKYKAELKKKAEEEIRRKEEERLRKEEERRRKEEERRKALEEKRKAEEEERRQREEEIRRRAEKERLQREEEERARKIEEERLRKEEERLRKEEAARHKEIEERMKAAGLRIPPSMQQAIRTGNIPRVPEPPPPSPSAAPRPPAPTTAPQPPSGLQQRPAGTGPQRDSSARQHRGPSAPQQQHGPGAPAQQRGSGAPAQQRGSGAPPQQRGPSGPQMHRGPGGPQQRGSGGFQRRHPSSGPPSGPGGPPPRGREGGPPRSSGSATGTAAPARPRPLRDDARPVKLTTENLPQIGVMRDDRAGRLGRGKPGAAKDKDRKASERRKPKPSRIFELDEDMTVTSRPRTGRVGGPPPGSGRRPRDRHRRPGRDYAEVEAGTLQPGDIPPRTVRVQGSLTVAEFADKAEIPATTIIRQLLLLGEAVNLNQVLSPDHMELLAAENNITLDIIREDDESDIAPYLVPDNPEKATRRPPVVTIMGHVDHGKTTLLDRIRASNVVDDEFGGITQHIGAYHVSTPKGDIVFLDTPGHEAFTAMRARGASVTDLVILVVSADDGFMPQTIEAINHAQAAKVPLVVAVNKIDLPGADVNRIRQQALQHGLVPEELGGETIFVNISAKKGDNVDQLLEMVALQAEILDLKAEADRPAVGIVVESHVDPLRGAVATILVQKGTLRIGDAFVVGDISGRVRAMNDDRGRPIQQAGPSFPAEILGLTGSPSAGETFVVMPDERSAREVAAKREVRRRLAGLAPTKKHITLEGLSDVIAEGQTKELNVILKGDVQGSIEAVSQSLQKIGTEQVRIRVLHAAVGGVNESDVNLADASDAIIIGFNVRPEPEAAALAERQGVEIKLYRIIYDLLEDVKKALAGILEPKFEEKVIGHAEVRQLFKISRVGTVAGCYVKDGEIVRDAKVRIVRDSVVVYEGKLSSLKRFKDDVKRVLSDQECGLSIENYNDLKEGDIIEAFLVEQVEATLDSPV